ncbi:MAG: cation diffusion facilitator family transporter [Candidatus Thermoplasmatota archaeon]|jgi:cation diffusion facilitator family transporter|nr:cation diffusion facilitator family transporter [Candidatus Thermoplasmatota archaeon]MCL5984734.1 cation diffusion facilitator family transporter [Candidatus Thermoplasmatota archaeon]
MRTRRVVILTTTISTLFFSLNLIAFAVSGSKAVLSQALYAVTDILGGLMIYWGMRASREPPDHVHPFGRGKERFFWAFTAGLVTFSLTGAVVMIYGILQILDPVRLVDLRVDIGVVAATMCAGGLSLYLVLGELRKFGISVQDLMSSDSQEMKIMLVQDVLGVVGALVALTGISLVYLLHDGRFDGVAAAFVGAILIGAGIEFAMEAKELLVGKAIPVTEGKEILSIVERYPFIRGVEGMQSMVLGPEDLLVILKLNFVDGLNTDDIEMHIDQLRRFVMGQCPSVRHLILEPVAERSAQRRIPHAE